MAMVLMEFGAIRRDLGQLMLATAILDDTTAWVMIAVISGITTHGTVSLTNVRTSIAGTMLFLALSFTIAAIVTASACKRRPGARSAT